MFKKMLYCFFILPSLFSNYAFAEPVGIVAAENFYGDVAEKIGGPYVHVISIMRNPNQDPHLFNLNPSHAKAISEAKIIIYNGLNYDSWMENIIAVNRGQTQKIIVVANLRKKNLGDNPHIWYDPNTMLTYGEALATALSTLDPAHKKYFQEQVLKLQLQHQQLIEQINALKLLTQNHSMIATEPVFNYMAEALGMKILGLDFQISVMNESEPSISQTKNFEQQLKTHAAKLFIYNYQVSSPLTEFMKILAKKEHIPTIGVSETQPEGQTYWQWMHNQLLEIQNALQEKNAH